MKTLLLLLTAALTMSAADVTGKWFGTMSITGDDGSLRERSAAAELTQSSDKVTGTIGPLEHQVKIKTGKLTGNKLVLDVEPPEGGEARFELTLSGDDLDGSLAVKGEDGTQKGKLKLKRQ